LLIVEVTTTGGNIHFVVELYME